MTKKHPPRPFRDVGLLSLLALLLIFLTGCVYLRLLDVKKQLQNFDSNFIVGGRSELIIEFKNPVLRAKDTKFLIGSDPVSQRGDNEVIQHYTFDMVRSSTETDHPPLGHLSLDLAIQNGKLTKIIVPEKFMLLFPRNVVVETLKQAKNADIYELRKLARGHIQLEKEEEAQLPSLTKTLVLMGPPFATANLKNLQVLTYRYRIPNAKREVSIVTQLSFDEAGLLHKAYVHWDQSSIEALFARE